MSIEESWEERALNAEEKVKQLKEASARDLIKLVNYMESSMNMVDCLIDEIKKHKEDKRKLVDEVQRLNRIIYPNVMRH